LKPIQPVAIWVNGTEQNADLFNLTIINDNLSDTATFYYTLSASVSAPQQPGAWLANGNLTISGQDYIDWNNQPNVNDWAYEWAAQQLNLTLI